MKNKAMARLHLEYCMYSWSACLRKGIAELERVQTRVMRRFMGQEKVSCEDGLKRLRRKRLRGHMMKVHMLVNDLERLEQERLASLSHHTTTRSHSMELKR